MSIISITLLQTPFELGAVEPTPSVVSVLTFTGYTNIHIATAARTSIHIVTAGRTNTKVVWP